MIKTLAIGFALLLAAGLGWIGWLAYSNGPAALDLADRLAGGGSQAHRVAADVPFGAHGVRLDIWEPATLVTPAPSRPVVVFFYGGGWHSGARADYGFAARALAAQGFLVVIPDYRQVPDVHFPAFVADSAAAVAWVQANIGRYGGDRDRIMLAGHSAGAYNAAMIALDPQWLAAAGGDVSAIRGVAGLAGPYDFLPLEPGDSADKAMGMVQPLDSTQPIRFARGDAPPLWLATGDADTTVKPRNSRNLAAAILALGGQADVRQYADMGHSDIIMALAVPFRSKGPVLDDMAAALHEMAAAPMPAPQ
jgi:acetyl esterase/lipase